jgi:putative phosphoesterase
VIVGIISDIHENYHNLLKALDAMRDRGVEQILCLGDLMNAGIAQVLAHSGIPVFSIWGNNDGDKTTVLRVALAKGSNLTMGGLTYAFHEIDARKVFLTHYPDLARPMARLQEFDAVFYGHNHRKSLEQIGECLVVNPGEISAHKTGTATFVLYDTELNQVEFVPVPDAISTRTRYVVEKLPAGYSPVGD